MELDILTLAIISCLIYLCQVIALFVQYRVNRTYGAVKWWLMGTTLAAFGVIFMPLVMSKSLIILAMIANPLVVLGQVFLYIGTVKFLDKKETRWALTTIFIVFIFLYYYFMFVNNGISSRTLVFTATMSVLLFMSVINLIRHKKKIISISAIFTSLSFGLYGIFSIIRFFWVLFLPPMSTYFSEESGLTLSFVLPIVSSLLWTFGFIIMLNQRLNSENREEKEKLQKIFNTSPDAAIISRASDGLIVDVNAGYSVMTGYPRSELVGNRTALLNIWKNIADRVNFVSEIMAKGSCENREYGFIRKDGSEFFGSVSAKTIMIQSEPHIIKIIHDITNRKIAEKAIRDSEELYRSILEASPDDITITDLNGLIQVISPAAKDMFGYISGFDDFIGTQVTDYIVPEDRERAKANIVHLLNGEPAEPHEYRGLRNDGSFIFIEIKSGIIHDANEKPSKLVFIIRDVTERHQAQQKIQDLLHQIEKEKNVAVFKANTDSLTGLANRRNFDKVLNTEFHRLKRSKSQMSLIMLDVDHFKEFNDKYGHLAGDNCLRAVGSILKTTFGRASDFVARFGGEEFVAILTDTDQCGATILAERIRKEVETLTIPHLESDNLDHVTVSLGVISVYPYKMTSSVEIVTLVDQALYQAKNNGRNQVYITPPELLLEKVI